LPATYSSFSSEDLVKACVGPDNQAAWTEFVRRFRPMIAKVVLRTTRRWTHPHPHLLDDLIQDTFLKLCADHCALLQRFDSRHQDSIFGFLKVVAASVVHDHFKFERAQKRDAAQTDTISDKSWSDPPRSPSGGSTGMEDRVTLRQIDEALCRLFPGENLVRNRAIFWLHHREGMTASAIASIPSIKLSTKGVETALRRMTLMIQSHIGSST
jgi:RNA polymerase sigma-70 factor (ECF subfamily)